MASRPDPSGALLVDKPPGPTSHDVVAFVRRTLGTSRVGHTGTLDPLATGLLVALVGHGTRMAQFLAADEKEYVADVRLGIATPTYDAASLTDARGPTSEVRVPTDVELEALLSKFRGSFLQIPPPFSAKKVAGVAAYEKARKNQPIELKPVPVTVRALEVLGTSDIGNRTSDIGPRTSGLEQRDATLLRLRVVASAGFYVRSLAHDIGQALGCGAHLEALRRTRVGRFRIEDALTLDVLERRGAEALIPLNDLLADMPPVSLSADDARRAGHGNPLKMGTVPFFPVSPEMGTVPISPEKGDGAPRNGDCPLFRLLDPDGTLLAVAERRPDGLLHPLVVLR